MTEPAAKTEFRSLETHEEWHACVSLQEETWGGSFRDIVPASMLQVSRKIGGFVGGAFDEDGALAGFAYSLPGRFEDTPMHWSHMLAVRAAARGRGLGRKLKLYQREAVLAQGFRAMYWTYDPMQARNAHLNVNRLGAAVVKYVPNMYGADTGSPLHIGGETDRLIVRWDLERPPGGPWTREPPAPPPDPGCVVARPAAGRGGRTGRSAGAARPAGSEVFIEIPMDAESLPAGDLANRWRATVREAFMDYLERGYRVHSLVTDAGGGRSYYRLRLEDAP